MSPTDSPTPAPARRPVRLGRLWAQVGRIPLMAVMLSVLCGLGIVQTLVHIGTGVQRSVTWRQEAQATQAENARLRQDIQILNDAKVQLNSPQYLEQLARCWGYVGQGEKVLVVEDAPATVGSNCDEYRLP
ncbi:hypothetical protein GCM10017783_14660 [Deinococcus piscis]|uniref:Cell division protein FtsB n=1 Tax=Deinococcus piscis TaxID=394230 RepID=A0ABQ3KBE1_9DEIO|nr:septum formation initiator family protein [Deinococcus piscis]GHG03305.1 hypothetical protein GCM10017783_14660 [Deinococcus piscis]